MSSKLNILLADDSKFFRAIESKFLQNAPVEILEATNCAEVHDQILNERPALIYMSFTLPDEGGDKCCSEIKKDPELKAIPIIMVCDQNAEQQPATAQRSGCDACLVKPLDRYTFLQAGRQFLEGIREHRQPSFFRLTFTSGGEDFAGKCLDISGGGMFIETPAEVPVGTLINMQFKLPDGPVGAIICSGEVTWQNRKPNPRKSHYPNGLGVKFVGLSNTAHKSILRFYEK
jgi:CheY-like chemotaxis protein/Tfp pilus assembly protein PilZ